MPIAHSPLNIAAVMSEPRRPMLVNLTTMHVNLTIPDNNYHVRPQQCKSDYHVNGQSVNLIAMVQFPLPVNVILSSSTVTFTKLRSVTKALIWRICWRSLVVCLM